MEKTFLNFFNTLNVEGKARVIIKMPYGSVVELIADNVNYDYIEDSNNVDERDVELLKKLYLSKCESLINKVNSSANVVNKEDSTNDFTVNAEV